MTTKAEIRHDNELWSNRVVDSMTHLEATLVFAFGVQKDKSVVSCINTKLSRENLKVILKQMILALED